jgi:RNA polymerase sigma-70 factor (ECF subfamily)
MRSKSESKYKCLKNVLQIKQVTDQMAESMTDIDLLRQLRAGDREAFSTLYRRHQMALYRYAIFRCRSVTDAEDLLQDVFVGLFQNKFQYDPLSGDLRYFLFGVMRNLAMRLDATRQRHGEFEVLPEMDEFDEDDCRSEPMIAQSELPCERFSNAQLTDKLGTAMAHLPPHYRDVFILVEIQELTYLEVAGICQINLGTVRSRLSRAKAMLAKRLIKFQLLEPQANPVTESDTRIDAHDIKESLQHAT